MRSLVRRSKAIIASLDLFMTYYGLIRLRPYQLEAAQAVLQSIRNNDGETFVWKFARQGGKDETLAALYQYLMLLYCRQDISIIAAAPTFKPQTEIAMRRLTDRLSQNIVLKNEWGRQLGYIFRLRRARALFLSADPSANVVGATAWPLLVINEAQDVLPAVYDKRFAPMAAAHNATRLFSGTAWTSNTLLAREERACRLKQEQDGLRRVFIVNGSDIAGVHPPYGRFLESEMSRLGANHPIVISQYLCRELDAQSGMFNAARRALMKGDQVAEQEPIPGGIYGFMLDVAGQDENRMQDPEMALQREGRDAVSLTIARTDLSMLSTLQAPIYRVVKRLQWTGLRHLVIFGKLKALADQWRPQHIVIDATGVGEGLWDMLDKAFPTKVLPVKFTQQVKSEIGYRFLSIIETGRFRDCSGEEASSRHRQIPHDDVRNTNTSVGAARAGQPQVEDPASSGAATAHPAPPRTADPLQAEQTVASSRGNRQIPHDDVRNTNNSVGVGPSQVDRQYAACQSEILIGPQKTMRWGVPDGTRDENGELIHDDILLADSLVARLDQLQWTTHSPTLIVPAVDPLAEMSRIR